MALTFPNRSRSFDSSHNRVRFSGYDGMFQVQYYLETDALALNGRNSQDEDRVLEAFDAQWDKIAKVAARTYSSSRKSLYVLTPDDF